MTDRLNINLAGTTFADETHTDVGAAAFELDHDWFTQEDLVIRTAAAGGGTLLVLDTDYVLSGESVDDATKGVAGLSTRSGKTVFHYIQVINAAYQTGTLYFSGEYIGDSIDADDYNLLLSRLRPKGHLFGLTMSNGGADPTNDIDTAAGEAVDNSDGSLMVLASLMTKQLDAAWAAGTNAGGRDTGAIADGWWARWLIMNPTTGAVDVLFSLSGTAPTMPAGFTKKRRISWLLRLAGAIVPFDQYDDLVLWRTVIVDRVWSAASNTTRNLLTVTAPPNTIVIFDQNMGVSAVSPHYFWCRHTSYTDAAASAANTTLSINGSFDGQYTSRIEVPVDASSQVAHRSSATTLSFGLDNIGYRDSRGRAA